MSEFFRYVINIIVLIDVHNGIITAIATILIATFTIVLARVTRYQAVMTKETIDLTRDQFYKTYRPRLRVRRITLHETEGDPIKFNYMVVNVGEALATLKKHEIILSIQSTNNTTKPIEHYLSLECRELRPGESVEFSTSRNFGDKFEFDCGWAIHGGGGTLKIRGVVAYEDSIGTMRRTGFLRTYDAELERFRASDDIEEEYED